MSGPRSSPHAVLRWALVGVLLVGAWWLVANSGVFDRLLVASPGDVVQSFRDDSGLLASNTWVTAQEALLGLALAIAVGFVTAVLLFLSPVVRDTVYPVLIGSQSVPIVILAPLLVLLLGYGLAPKLLIVALVCFFPITVGTLDGLRGVDPELPRMMRTLGASRRRIFRLVELPAAMPRFAGGVRIAATWAFIGAVFGEYSGSTSGLGYLIARGTPSFETGRVYAAVLLLMLSSLALFGLTGLLERRLMPWANRTS